MQNLHQIFYPIIYATAAPEYVQYLAVGTSESTPRSTTTESAVPPKVEPPKKQIFFKVRVFPEIFSLQNLYPRGGIYLGIVVGDSTDYRTPKKVAYIILLTWILY